MSDELKPCPFCGCEDCQSWNPGGVSFYLVECTGCGARTQYMAPESAAIAAWNRRVEVHP